MWNLFLSHKHKTLSPGVSFLSTIPMCATRTPLIQRCLLLLRYENLRLFLFNVSFSHTNTNSVSQGLIFLHCSLVCRSHTPSLPRDILRSLICLSSYHSRCEISFSPRHKTPSLWISFLSDICLYVSHMQPLSISLTPTHITQPSDPLDSYLQRTLASIFIFLFIFFSINLLSRPHS